MTKPIQYEPLPRSFKILGAIWGVVAVLLVGFVGLYIREGYSANSLPLIVQNAFVIVDVLFLLTTVVFLVVAP